MMISPLHLTLWIWAAWLVSWLMASLWSDRTEARPGLQSEVLYRIVALAGTLLLFVAPRYFKHGARLWAAPAAVSWFLVGLTAAGFVFCWWARIHLGRMWSSTVTRKAEHRIVTTGPYAWVRHPIYTGIIVAASALAALQGTVTAVVGFALIFVSMWIKARLEERFLRQELGPEKYDAYARGTGMLFPGL